MWTTLVDLLRRVKDSRKAIVVLTDGVDESLLADPERSDHSFEELLAHVSEEDATMQPIYLNREEAELKRELSGSFYDRETPRADRAKVKAKPYGSSATSSLLKRAPGRSS
jgi:hypothetical protein